MSVYGHVVIATGLTHVGREDVSVTAVEYLALEIRGQRSEPIFVILQCDVPVRRERSGLCSVRW